MDPELTFEVTEADQRQFGDILVRWQALAGKSMAAILRQQARLIAVNLAHNTQPYGFDGGARDRGRNAVMRDVGRLYVSLDKVFASVAAVSEQAGRAFYAAAKRGDQAAAQHIMRACGITGIADVAIGKFDPTLHAPNRNRRGRVSSARKPVQIVTDPRVLDRYKQLVVSRVGLAKSSWATCAEQLGGTRGIPLWAKKNRGPGRVSDQSGRLNDPRVVLSSGIPWMSTVLPDAAANDAVAIQFNKMEKMLEHALAAEARKAGLNTDPF